MRSISNPQFVRVICLSAIWLLGAPSASIAEPERITFAYKNWSDLRGILNVLETFHSACLTEPVTQELPAQLLPEGYQVVSSGLHALGLETGPELKSVVLSKTGDETMDFAEGEPFIELTFASEGMPSGKCRVAWSRAWDYSEGVNEIMTSTAVLFDAWLSYTLKAVRVSRPQDGFKPSERHSLVSEWAVPCFSGNWCRVAALLELQQDEGIRLSVNRSTEPVGPQGAK